MLSVSGRLKTQSANHIGLRFPRGKKHLDFDAIAMGLRVVEVKVVFRVFFRENYEYRTVRVPKGLPPSQYAAFYQYCHKELDFKYKGATKADFIWIRDYGTRNWAIARTLDTSYIYFN